MTKPLTYKDAGVDIGEQDRFIEKIRKINPRIGGFSGAIPVPWDDYEDPCLVAGTDGVGTKVLVAEMAGRFDTVGIDLVAMVVNDLICCGAQPLFFLDYYATGRLNAERAGEILKGIVEGCRQAESPLIGGETAEMPGTYSGDHFDLAGFGVGIVDRKRMIDGQTVAAGDIIIGLPSSGIHSNGFSLARKVLLEKMGLSVDSTCEGLSGNVGETLLIPTRIYVSSVMNLLQTLSLKAIAHITGGGLLENIPRVLPEGVHAEIDSSCWTIPEIFRVIEKNGPVDREEMLRTFNMGIGMTIVIDPQDEEKALAICVESGFPAAVVGQITDGERGVTIR